MHIVSFVKGKNRFQVKKEHAILENKNNCKCQYGELRLVIGEREICMCAVDNHSFSANREREIILIFFLIIIFLALLCLLRCAERDLGEGSIELL